MHCACVQIRNGYQLESDVQEGCELTLRDLQLDHLDLYLIHWPARVRKGAVTGKMTKDDQMGYDQELMAQTWRVRDGRKREEMKERGREKVTEKEIECVCVCVCERERERDGDGYIVREPKRFLVYTLTGDGSSG